MKSQKSQVATTTPISIVEIKDESIITESPVMMVNEQTHDEPDHTKSRALLSAMAEPVYEDPDEDIPEYGSKRYDIVD
jgi:hypothetical protein